ncbi:MAG TPA: hypothetical protein VFQ61_37295 [Polyangiaceae bacterium]|nr:hypothetical protein [Polyangiaceae bacterium]
MSASQLVSKIPGVRRCIVTDGVGHVLEGPAEERSTAEVSRAAVGLFHRLCEGGALLGLGQPQLVTVRAAEGSRVVGFRGEASISVEVDPKLPRSIGQVESTLLRNDWTAEGDWLIDESDIECLAPEGETAAPPWSPSNADVGWTELRSALARSDAGRVRLQRPRRSAARPSGLQSAGLGIPGFESLIDALTKAVESIDAGDNHAGLEALALLTVELRDTPPASTSLRWLTELWSARAILHAGEALDAADAHAQAALAEAGELDLRARALSTLLIAEVALYRRHLNRCLELVRDARELFTDLKDDHELASCWLLEARALAASVRDNESLRAAEQAHHHRPSWPPPLTFLVKRALCAGRVSDAEQALEPMLARETPPLEVTAHRCLLDHVKAGTIASHTAYEYLRLLDSPPTRGTLRQLEALVRAFPTVEQFQETLGCKLLHAGHYESAALALERLAVKRGAPSEQLQAALTLARACLGRTHRSSQADHD